MRWFVCILGLGMAWQLGLAVAAAEETAVDNPTRVLKSGEKLDDARAKPPKDYNGYFPFTPPKTRQAWEARAEQLRRQLLVANGLWPMPEHTPHNAVIHGKVERPGYTVERVYFESYPGHFVTGSLYRPTGKTGKLPAVLCPHGHWNNGRFHDANEQNAKKEIASGADEHMSGARYPLQARCVQLARMGCVVFHYDMIGYADSVQIDIKVAHKINERRPEMEKPDSWGFFTPQAELRLQSIMGLQTYNSLRALDWIRTLPDVDSDRIAMTGASGGGTQTFILAALDPRVKVAFPAVMVSTAMQGGCTCENCSYLRVGTGNIEIASLIAPRPLGMTAANDWTKEIQTKGLPELKELYALMGAPDHVEAKSFLQFGHNYNGVSRGVMYAWLNKHLKLGHKEPIKEQAFEPLSISEMTVWNDKHPKPDGGPAYERKLTQAMVATTAEQLQPPFADDSAFAKALAIIKQGWKVISHHEPLGNVPGVTPASIKQTHKSTKQGEGFTTTLCLLTRDDRHEQVPAMFIRPTKWNGDSVIIASGQGKASLLGSDGKPAPAIESLLSAGFEVIGVDVRGQGEASDDGKLQKANVRVKGDRAYAGFTYGYNMPLFGQRVDDLVTTVTYLEQLREGLRRDTHLLGVDGGGIWALAARNALGSAIKRCAADTAGFRFESLTAYDHPDFVPGAVSYRDVPGLMAGSAGLPLWVAGETEDSAALTIAAFNRPRNKSSEDSVKWLVLSKVASKDAASEAVRWLIDSAKAPSK